MNTKMSAEDFFNLGQDKVKEGNYGGAIEDYKQAIIMNHSYIEAYLKLSHALLNLGLYEEAISICDRALEIQPDAYKAWEIRGISLHYLGRYEEAIVNYDKVLEVESDLAPVLYNKSCSYALHGNIDLALENLQKAIVLGDDDYQEMAKNDSDFNGIQHDERFEALIKGSPSS